MPDPGLVAAEERLPAGGAAAGRPSDPTRIGFLAFLAIAAQAALVLALPVLYRIEHERGLAIVAGILLVGFLIHAWLPASWRVPFFVLLTMTAAGILLGTDAVWLAALGLALLGLCHLPAAWGVRVALVAAAGAALGAVTVGWIRAPWGEDVLPILGAMFMFRIFLYLYDLKTDRTPATPWQRVAYFFLLPNLCFPLFPIVDYKTFLKKRYDEPAARIYQKGAFWMMRGVSHLLLYRLVYYLLPRADQLTGILGVAVFMAMTYGLYLRVSGLYHFIVGSLCLFGWNLPPTNHNYYLASGFNDLWRRANIYWKDFMMTTVFNPLVVGLRRWKVDTRIAVAAVVVAILTWFLHSYQWFWLVGTFPVSVPDLIFWGVLGLGLSVNTIWQARRGRKRRLGKPSWSWTTALGLTLRTMGVFFLIALLWLLWDTGSIKDWGYRLLQARESTPANALLFVGLMAGVAAAGVVAQWLTSKGWGWEQAQAWAWRRSSWVVPVLAVGLLLVGLPSVHLRMGPKVTRLAVWAASSQPNRLDAERRERGYYETLSRSIQVGGQLDVGERFLPGNWEGFSSSDAVRRTDDIRGYEIIPNVATYFKTAPFHANRWGMRDRDYEQAKPPGTHRIALMGGSREMGSGVGDGVAFENVVEDRLNRERTGRGFDRYEILNFAVGGYSQLQTLYVLEHVVPPFEPDAVLCVVYPDDASRAVDRVQMTLHSGGGMDVLDPFVRDLMDRARVAPDMPAREFRRRFDPYEQTLLTATYERQVDAIRRAGAKPVFLLVNMNEGRFTPRERAWLERVLAPLDVPIIELDLREIFRGYDAREIQVAPWDTHPNARGHQLIADALYESILEHADAFGLPAAASAPSGS